MIRLILILCVILSLPVSAQVVTTNTNVNIPQRNSGGRLTDRNMLGSSNLWEIIGFNGSGVLGAYTLSEYFAGAAYTVGSAQITDGAIVNADIDASAAIADTKLATISTAGKVSDSALSANVALEGTANTFTQSQTVNLAGTTAITLGRSDGVADGTGQELRVLLGTGGGDTSGALLGHYSLTSGTKTAKNFFRFYDSGFRFDDASSVPGFDVNISTDTAAFGSSAGSEQFFGKLYVGGTFNTGATNNVRGLLVAPTITLGGGFAAALYDAAGTTDGSANIDHLVAYQARGIHDSNGTINDLSGFSSIMVNNGGAATNAYGFKVFDVTGTGTVTNNYGLYVDSLTKGTNDYAVYTAGATPSYFGGGVETLGASRTVPTTMGALDVDLTKALNTKTISGNATFTFIGSLVHGKYSELQVLNTGASAATVSLPASVYQSSGAAVVASLSVPAAAGGIPGMTHVVFGSDGTRLRIYQGGGGGGTGDAQLDGGNTFTGTQNVTGNVVVTGSTTVSGALSAGTLAGNGSAVTQLSAANIQGPFPDNTFGKIRTATGLVLTPNPIAATTGSSITVVTNAAENVITLNEASETILFDAQPETGKVFTVRMMVDLPDPVTVCDVTWPSTWSFAAGTLRTLLKVPDNKPQSITVWWTGTEYQMSGDPYEIAELPEDTTPAITAAVPIDQGNGTERTSLAKIRDLFEPDWIGSFATPSTAATISGAFDAMSLYVVTGGNQEIDLEDATGYGGQGIVFYFDGTSTMTVDPAAGDVIYINGTAMAADEKLIISGTAGQVGIIVSDDANWSTSGGNATYTQETP